MTRLIANAATPAGHLEDIDTTHDWTGALCREMDPELWFPAAERAGPSVWDVPRAICGMCPLRDACLEYALEREGRDHYQSRAGMYGGKTPRERWEIAKERKRT